MNNIQVTAITFAQLQENTQHVTCTKLNEVLNVLLSAKTRSRNLNFLHRGKRQGGFYAIGKCNLVNRNFLHWCNLGRNDCSHTWTRCSVVSVVLRRGRMGGGVLELIKIMSGSASCLALASTPPCISQGWRPFSLGNGGSIETKVIGCASCLAEVIDHFHTVRRRRRFHSKQFHEPMDLGIARSQKYSRHIDGIAVPNIFSCHCTN